MCTWDERRMPRSRHDFTTPEFYASSLLKILLIFSCFPFSKEEDNWGQAELESGDFHMKFSESIPRTLIRCLKELSQIFDWKNWRWLSYQLYQIKHSQWTLKSDFSEAVRLLLLLVQRELMTNQAIIRSCWGRAEPVSSYEVTELHHTPVIPLSHKRRFPQLLITFLI